MRVEHFKRWHWGLIGLTLGLAVSLWRGWVGPEGTLLGRSTLESSEFEKLLLTKSPTSGQPQVKDIRFFGEEDGRSWLIAQQLVRRGRDEPEVYIPVKIPAKKPFVSSLNPTAKVDANFTVVDYLKTVKAKHPEVRFSTRWWDQEPVRSPMFALVGMVLAALAGQPLVHALLGAGLGREPDKKGEEYDLSRFGKGGPEKKEPVKKGPSEQDIAHLRELEAELERQLAAKDQGGGAAPDSAAPATQQSAPSDQPIKKLDGGPLEAQADNKPKQAKRYGGEFYPTETHVKPEEK
jgi:hypothetical protein